MNRRLYFVVANPADARRLVDELQQAGLDETHIHVLARARKTLDGLPAATSEQQHDRGHTVERTLWNGNLALFAVAAAVLVGLLITRGATLWTVVPGAVMVASVIAGVLFTHVPNTHLDEFRDAMAHGELVVMADVPRGRVASIEEAVHRRQPEATLGGVGWSTDALRV
ncbi:MAG: hypothetical protein WCC36_00565 [Gammaproteobacteria bacterium]